MSVTYAAQSMVLSIDRSEGADMMLISLLMWVLSAFFIW